MDNDDPFEPYRVLIRAKWRKVTAYRLGLLTADTDLECPYTHPKSRLSFDLGRRLAEAENRRMRAKAALIHERGAQMDEIDG